MCKCHFRCPALEGVGAHSPVPGPIPQAPPGVSLCLDGRRAPVPQQQLAGSAERELGAGQAPGSRAEFLWVSFVCGFSKGGSGLETGAPKSLGYQSCEPWV